MTSVLAEVSEVEPTISQTGKHILYVLFKDDTGFMRGIWFGQSFLTRKFSPGQRVLLHGKFVNRGMRFQVTHPKVTWLEPEQEITQGQLLPVYRMTDGLNQRQMREMVKATIGEFAVLVEEAMPTFVRERADVCDIQTAIQKIHFPTDHEQLEEARGRLVYQELLILQLALAHSAPSCENKSVGNAIGINRQGQSANFATISFRSVGVAGRCVRRNCQRHE